MTRLTNREVLAAWGESAEGVADGLARFAATTRALSSDKPRLIEKHPQEWVALCDDVEITAPTLSTGLRRLRSKVSMCHASPEIAGLLVLPGLGRRKTSFLFDTGADMTVLMPVDSKVMGIDHSKFNKEDEIEVTGVGGKAIGHRAHGLITFSEEDKTLHTYRVNVIVMEPTDYNEETTSIIGRDLMEHWTFRYDCGLRLLEILVNTSHNVQRPKRPKRA